MIYLKPTLGLGNRLRVMQSALYFCKKYRRDLTILWVNNVSLNCSFHDMFQIPKLEGVEVKIIECSEVYPKVFLNQLLPVYLKSGLRVRDALRFYLVRPLVTIWVYLTQNKNLIQLRKDLISIQNNFFIDEEIHPLIVEIDKKPLTLDTMHEEDKGLIEKIETKIEVLFNSKNKNILICSGHQLSSRKDCYHYFVPPREIQKKIDEVVKNFDFTFGLHLRYRDKDTDGLHSQPVDSSCKHLYYINEYDLEEVMTRMKDLFDQNKDLTFFLACNNNGIKEKIKLRFGKKIITYEIGSYVRSQRNAIQDAVVDLFCLSKTEKIFGCLKSSYSKVAADIGGIELKFI